MVLKGIMVATFGRKEGRGDRDRNKVTGDIPFLNTLNVTWVCSFCDNSLTFTLLLYIFQLCICYTYFAIHISIKSFKKI